MKAIAIRGKRQSTIGTLPIVRCGSYTRVSKSDTRSQHFTSLAAQGEAIDTFIASQRSRGWVLTERYCDDGKSGKDTDREDFQRMLADVAAGKLDMVVVHRVDRLSRSLRDFAQIMGAFQERNVNFASVTQSFDTSDAMGRFTLNILITFAEFEREMIVERTRGKIAASRAQGEWSGGLLPFGYTLKDKRLTPLEGESETTRMAFERYEQIRSSMAVADYLNEQKRPTKGRMWKKQMRTPPRWTKDMVLRMLRNPLYAGYMPHGDELHEGIHKPIVSRETFDRVARLLGYEAIHRESHGRNPDYILQGVLTCGCKTSGVVCKHSMVPLSTRKGRTEYRYYRCVGREKKGTAFCAAPGLPADAIETLIAEQIRKAANGGTVAAELRSSTDQLSQAFGATLRAEVAKLPATIKKLAAEGAELMAEFPTAKEGTRRLITARADELGIKLRDAEARLADASKRLAVLEQMNADTEWALEQLGSLDQVWDHLTADNRHRLIRAIVRTIRVDESSVTIVFSPLDRARLALVRGMDPTVESDGPADVEPLASIVRVDLHRIRRMAVEFQTTPPPPKPEVTRHPARIANTLALAHKLDRAIDNGTFADQAALAKALKMTRARVSQVLDLVLLAPDLQETVLHMEAVGGLEPLHEHTLRAVVQAGFGKGGSWEAQRKAWARIVAPTLKATG